MLKNLDLLIEPFTRLVESFPNLVSFFAGLVMIGLFSKQLEAAEKLLLRWLKPLWIAMNRSFTDAQNETKSEFQRFYKFKAAVYFGLALCSLITAVFAIGNISLIFLGLIIKQGELPPLSFLGLAVFAAILAMIATYTFGQARFFMRLGKNTWKKSD